MREIKFNFWDTVSKEMISWKLALNMELEGDLTIKELLTDMIYEPLQFTGMIDKNGLEIYEGDLLQISIFNHSTQKMIAQKIVPVEYKNYKFGVEWGNSDFTCLDGFTNTTFSFVGNIYENGDEN